MTRLFAVSLCLTVGISNAATLLQWNTFGNTGTETSEPSALNDSLLLATTLTLGAGITGAGNGNRFGGSAWFDSGDTTPSTLAESIFGNDYIEFVVTPVPGHQFTASSFVFSWERSATGPSSVALRSSADGFSNDLGSVTGLPDSLSTGNSIAITAVNERSAATTFRLYGYGGTNSVGTGGFDTTTNVVNVQLNGATSPVPEPTAALSLFGGFGLLLALRRRSISRNPTRGHRE